MRLKKRDLKILHLLEKDSSLSAKQISERTGVPLSTVFRRKKRFEEEGLIKKYKAILNPEKIGEPFHTMFFVNTEEGVRAKGIVDELKEFDELKEIIQVQGSWDLVLIGRTKTMRGLKQLTNQLNELNGVRSVDMNLILVRQFL